MVVLAFPPAPASMGPWGGNIPVVDPSRHPGERRLDRIWVLVGAIAALSDKGVRIPRERRFGNRNRSAAKGISIPARLVAELREITNLPEDF
ncbi:hypothetical protein HC022_03980 [Salipiger sp. HF18]|uniref:hypothetical protein n=1 Tax=Salipiger sp. HF18 TaxID=2721557 RepID=UPI00142DF73D|nr:hypothetical protein [Salipiger sp. HF18]NIY95435.1 hypothetical protein [Salipiger sp. HF18]